MTAPKRLREGLNEDLPFRIIKAIQYIKRHYREEISLEKVANRIGMSTKGFSRLFKQSMEINFTQYINNFRLEKAEKLLTKSTKSIKVISNKVGLNTDYFRKLFKGKYKIPPLQYRNKTLHL